MRKVNNFGSASLSVVIPPNSNTLNASRVVGQTLLTLQGNNNVNFRLLLDQVMLLETAANL